MHGVTVVPTAMEVCDFEICFCLQELLSRTSLETQKLNLMTEVSELKLKLVGMEKEQKEQEEKQKKAEVSAIKHPYCPKLRSGEAILMWPQAIWSTPSLTATECQKHLCIRDSSDLLIPSYHVLLWLQISAVPKPPHFGSRLYPTSGCWQGWKGADKTQRGIRVLLREMTMCWDGHCHCSWSLETSFNMHFSDPVATPRFCVSFLLMAPVGEPVHRLSLRECFPVTCFGFVFSGFIRH